MVDQAIAKRAHSGAIIMTCSNTASAAREGEAPNRIDQLRDVYARIAEAQARSLAAISDRGQALACPDGCGSCCESFIPDVLPVESDFLADWLLRERPDLARAHLERDRERERGAPSCPFHEGGRAGGCCGVYPARPLVCRLFGFASIRDREGVEAYSLCRKMPARGGRRSWSGAQLEDELGASLPVMADFSAAVVAIAPEEAGSRALLTEALGSSLRKLSLRLLLASLETESDPGGDEPEPSTPAPRAA